MNEGAQLTPAPSYFAYFAADGKKLQEVLASSPECFRRFQAIFS
jgi:hypothetical protein